MASFRPGDPGFDLDAPIVPPRPSPAVPLLISALIVLATTAMLLGVCFRLMHHQPRPPVLRGSLSQRLYVPALLANERVLIARTVGEAR